MSSKPNQPLLVPDVDRGNHLDVGAGNRKSKAGQFEEAGVLRVRNAYHARPIVS